MLSWEEYLRFWFCGSRLCSSYQTLTWKLLFYRLLTIKLNRTQTSFIATVITFILARQKTIKLSIRFPIERLPLGGSLSKQTKDVCWVLWRTGQSYLQLGRGSGLESDPPQHKHLESLQTLLWSRTVYRQEERSEITLNLRDYKVDLSSVLFINQTAATSCETNLCF